MSFMHKIASAVTAVAVAGSFAIVLSETAAAEPPPPSSAPVASPTADPSDPSRARGSAPQAEIDAYMKEVPGGEQVSDNAVSYRRGDVIVVFPNVGELRAPDGLGSNVRDNAPPLEETTVPAAYQEAGHPADTSRVATLTIEGCPYSTTSTADWYCFYRDDNYNGNRWQFQDTCSDAASNWGFNNMTTSWVNTNPYKVIYAQDTAGAPWMWKEGLGITKSSNVGSTNNDKLSNWYVVGGGC